MHRRIGEQRLHSGEASQLFVGKNHRVCHRRRGMPGHEGLAVGVFAHEPTSAISKPPNINHGPWRFLLQAVVDHLCKLAAVEHKIPPFGVEGRRRLGGYNFVQ